MSEIWLAIQTNFVEYLLVLARVSGIFSFNPIFSRSGIPGYIKVGGSMLMALVMVAAGGFEYVMPDGMLPFAFDIAKEMLVGAVLGFFVNIMLQVFGLAGDISDMQIGLSMARSYDPTFGNAGITTQYYNYWFMLYFFAVGGHLSYIKLFALSFETIPIGYTSLNINLAYILVMYFETVLTLGMKLAMPVVAASLISEFCLGVLMKAVPTIHVFVLNIQIKLLVGFVVLAASCGAISEFMEEIMDIMFTNLNGIIGQFVLSS